MKEAILNQSRNICSFVVDTLHYTSLYVLSICSSLLSHWWIRENLKNFLQGSTEEKKKFDLISWEQICTYLKYGGLGLKRLKDANVFLLYKWLWDLGKASEKDNCWEVRFRTWEMVYKTLR